MFNRADRIADRITDFSAVDDIMHIDNFAFRGVGKDGALASGVFHLVAVATDAAALALTDTNDRLVYNRTTGSLFYDADGRGGVAAFKLAALNPGVAISTADFLVI